jgi:hypothetical protein
MANEDKKRAVDAAIAKLEKDFNLSDNATEDVETKSDDSQNSSDVDTSTSTNKEVESNKSEEDHPEEKDSDNGTESQDGTERRIILYQTHTGWRDGILFRIS